MCVPKNRIRYTDEQLLKIAENAIQNLGVNSVNSMYKITGITGKSFLFHGIDIKLLLREYGVVERGKGSLNTYTTDSLTELALAHAKATGINSIKKLAKSMGVAVVSFQKHKVDAEFLFAKAGIQRNSTGSIGKFTRDSILKSAAEEMRSQGRYIRLMELTKILGWHTGVLHVYSISMREIASLAGVVNPRKEIWLDDKCTPSKEELYTRGIEVILQKGRYVPATELAKLLGIPVSLIRNKIGMIKELNLYCGYKQDNLAFETQVYEVLLKVFPTSTIIRQHTFDGLRSDKNRPLEIDFFIPEFNLAIEADGPQHWKKSSTFYSERGIQLDLQKNIFCKSNEIHLVRIRYTTNISNERIQTLLSGIPLKHSVGQPAAEPVAQQEGPETIRKE